MPPPTRTPSSKWIEVGLRGLAAGGPDAVRVEQLAQALGVTKGSFYRHFDDRGALLEGMLGRLFALPSIRGRQLLKIELAIRDWARRDKAVAKRLRRIDNRRMDYMRSLFGAFCADEEEVEVRCMLAFSMFIGSHFIAAEHGLRSRPDVLSLALKRLLA